MIYHFILICGFVLLASSAQGALRGALDIHDYNGELEVKIPYKTILSAEIIPVNVRIENNGEEALRVIVRGQNDGYQLIWIPWKNGKADERPGWVRGEHYINSPIELLADNNIDPFETVNVAPGDSYEIRHINVYSLSQNLPHGSASAEFRPAFHGGGGKVIYGDPFKISVIPKPLKNFKKVFETTFTAGGDVAIPFEVYEVPIEGETYLFNNTGVRFCRLPRASNYSLSFKQERETLEYVTTVIFEDSFLEPHIFSWRKYQLVSASPETVPWLFEKPQEGIDVSDINSRMNQDLGDESQPTSSARPSRPASKEPDPVTEKNPVSIGVALVWSWIVGGCGLAGLLILIIFLIRRKYDLLRRSRRRAESKLD